MSWNVIAPGAGSDRLQHAFSIIAII